MNLNKAKKNMEHLDWMWKHGCNALLVKLNKHVPGDAAVHGVRRWGCAVRGRHHG